MQLQTPAIPSKSRSPHALLTTSIRYSRAARTYVGQVFGEMRIQPLPRAAGAPFSPMPLSLLPLSLLPYAQLDYHSFFVCSSFIFVNCVYILSVDGNFVVRFCCNTFYTCLFSFVHIITTPLYFCGIALFWHYGSCSVFVSSQTQSNLPFELSCLHALVPFSAETRARPSSTFTIWHFFSRMRTIWHLNFSSHVLRSTIMF